MEARLEELGDFWAQVLDFAEKTAVRVGSQLMADFGQVQAAEKLDGSLVTQSDKWADQEIREAIAAAFPTHGVLSEEGEHIFPDTEWCWIIDPLDGTTNFARGIPIWGISIGLFHQGFPVFGYVYLPPLKQTFSAFWNEKSENSLTENPQGAFLNSQPIHTSQDDLSKNHFFSFCTRSISAIEHPFPCKIRMLGVATYNFLMVAAGITLGGVEATPKIWDIAAVWTIINAAGGAWVPLEQESIFPLEAGKDYSNRSYPTLVLSRPDLVPVFQPLVQSLSQSAKP
ncbi:inositol monophosphatase family protein [Microcoleus sp. FACHB-672]|uniref:inositol monophosphatase family protein n=1 Tax=Microcoleus sp. FACHB-672 TaxID=2692825 RepID=UPI00168952AB|nr:inositol monophosphatase family protein [Microcoleus sp. FACHB-672]MBD2040930.1 inositol monophosphatase [Microcoleus sp. FACHB-672]